MSVKYVEYLQGDGGNSWFSTIELPSGTYKIEMKFNYSTIDTSVSNRLIGFANGSFYYQVNEYRNAQVTDADRSYYLLNDLIINDIITDTFTVNSSGTLCFFSNNSSRLSTAQIYYCKIYDTSDNLLYHFRGALDNNNTPCLHEVVNDIIYYNQGTGTFSHGNFIDALYLFANNNQGTAENLGSYRLYNMKIEGDSERVESGVDYVDCLIGDGASYIDTGMTIQGGYKIEVTFMSTVNNVNPNYYSVFGVGTPTYYSYDFNPPGISLWLESNALKYRNNGTTTVSYDASWYNKKYTQEIIAGDNVGNINNLFLFAVNNADKVIVTNPYGIASDCLRVYDFKIYNAEGTLIQHLRPCLDTEGVPCMYDEVSGEYFKNLGTGTFGYKKELRDFQPVLDSNNTPCLMDKINKKYYYSKNGNGFKYNGYTRVGYIQGDGDSWIDTGIYANPQYKYEISVTNISSTASSFERFFGTSDDTLSVMRTDNRNQLHITYQNKTYANGTTGLSIETNDIITVNKNIVSTNKTTYTLSEPTTTNSYSKTVLIFYDHKFEKKTSCGIQVHYFKMWNENGELVSDLIPILDNEGTPCMYDLVTETFFYNQGTGEFSYGAVEELECPPANYVEYIKQGANAYFDTLDISGMINSEVEVECKVNLLQSTTGNGIFGTVGGYNVNPFYCRAVYSKGNVGVEWSFFDGHVSATTTFGIHTIKLNKNGIYIDGELGAEIDPSKTYSESYEFVKPFALLAYNYWNGIQNPRGNLCLYYLTIKQAGELILDFRPCLDDNDVLCVYESVNGVYYYNSGTGKFSSNHGKSIGYTPIKYIETNGTQYIDTGVVPTDNTDIDMVARATGKGTTYKLDYRENTGYFNYSIPIHVDSFNSVITNHSDVTVRLDCYTESLGWGGVLRIVSGETVDFNASYVDYKYICICFESTDIVKFNEYTFMLNNFTDSFTGVYLEDLPACSLYLMNELMLDTTYKFKETNTNVEPNLTASAGATLTLGSTYSAYLTETEIEQAINNGWIIE